MKCGMAPPWMGWMLNCVFWPQPSAFSLLVKKALSSMRSLIHSTSSRLGCLCPEAQQNLMYRRPMLRVWCRRRSRGSAPIRINIYYYKNIWSSCISRTRGSWILKNFALWTSTHLCSCTARTLAGPIFRLILCLGFAYGVEALPRQRHAPERPGQDSEFYDLLQALPRDTWHRERAIVRNAIGSGHHAYFQILRFLDSCNASDAHA